MAKEILKIEGLSELKAALAELPKATSTNVLKRALTNAADPMQETAQRLAPRATGKLQRSITVGTKLSNSQKSKYKKINKVEIFVGPAPLKRSIMQEFGTVNHRPQPFMRPAFEQHWRGAIELIKKELWTEIDKARARIARKAARLINKT